MCSITAARSSRGDSSRRLSTPAGWLVSSVPTPATAAARSPGRVGGDELDVAGSTGAGLRAGANPRAIARHAEAAIGSGTSRDSTASSTSRTAYNARVKDAAVRVAGLLVTVLYAGFITWVYANQPRTVAQLTGGMAASVGAYEVDRASFNQGLQFFRNDQFEEARAALGRADPARQDPTTQFYVAYSYYRQGWGRLYNDDALFAEGAGSRRPRDRHRARAPARRARPQSIEMRTADELRAELRAGSPRTPSTSTRMRLLPERK